MFSSDYSVLVLPSPNTGRNGSSNTGNYPIMCSHSNLSGKKHFTLLPPLTNSQLIDNDLKYKLNKYSFGNGLVADIGIPSPSTSPVPDGYLQAHAHMHGLTDDCGLAHGHHSEYTAGLPTESRNGSLTSLSELDTASSPLQSKHKKLSSKRIVKKDMEKELQVPLPQNKIEQRRRYVCKVCSKAFTTSGHLARHNRIHTGEKNHICPFEGCNQRFSRHDNCIQHYRTHFKKKSAV